MTVQWDQSLSTGVAKIDAQHQALIREINNLLAAMRAGKGKEELGKMLNFLGDYAVKHFAEEEVEMEKAKCPAAPANKLAHQQFIRKFQEIQKRFQEEGPSSALVLEVQKNIVDWVTQHIRQVDTKLAASVKKPPTAKVG